MIIDRLTVCDFRVFSGEHHFDLAPKDVDGRTRPIILFGGLNGAGKTTILTAVRLGLYGKRSLGAKVSADAYQTYLAESIHRSQNALVPRDSAYLELHFTYARHGEKNTYRIRRAWTLTNGKVKETLKIYRDNVHLKEFDYKKAQSFLNELIPIGVSDLFFFDGEKIADLAEDETGLILREAVKKLLGLDIIERLRNDLSVYRSRNQTQALPEEVQLAVEKLNAEYQSAENKKESIENECDALDTEITALSKEIELIESEIDTLGGAWAQTRSEERDRQQRLIVQKEQVEKAIRDSLAGAFPLSLAKNVLSQLSTQLHKETEQRYATVISNALQERIAPLEAALQNVLPVHHHVKIAAVIEEVLPKHLVTPETSSTTSLLHDLADTETARLQHCIASIIPKSRDQIFEFKLDIDQIEEDLATSSIRLERAPDAGRLEKPLAELKATTTRMGVLQERLQEKRREIGHVIKQLIEFNRQLRKLHDSKKANWRGNACLSNAEHAGELLLDFADQTAKNKLNALEKTFIDSFHRLSRKEDLHLSARIDSDSFEVHLVDDQGRPVIKKELSAGERQIFAIAILEALAKTSGRKLPVIIDTPLGRLDSKHRTKLVENYFPHASHQVIILSTDTEVDRDFYNTLTPEISQAYEILYDDKQRSSVAKPGYFWRWNSEELQHAS